MSQDAENPIGIPCSLFPEMCLCPWPWGRLSRDHNTAPNLITPFNTAKLQKYTCAGDVLAEKYQSNKRKNLWAITFVTASCLAMNIPSSS